MDGKVKPNSNPTKGVYSDDDSFILSGPGRLGIFISAQSGAPTRPPLQLDSTSSFIVSIGKKLCAGGGMALSRELGIFLERFLERSLL